MLSHNRRNVGHIDVGPCKNIRELLLQKLRDFGIIMLKDMGLELSLPFGLRVIFLLFDLVAGHCCLLVSPYVNLAL